MTEGHAWMTRVYHTLHRSFLALMLGSFAAATLAPCLGLWLRNISFGRVGVGSGVVHFTPSSLLLALLLLNAGLGVRAGQLWGLLRRPFLLAGGFVANLVVPVLFIACLARLLRAVPGEDCVGAVTGFALLASLPVAASSTVWSQKADGDSALSLSLVVCSIFASPLVTPATLWAIDRVTGGVAGEELALLSGGGTSLFLTAFVLAPAVLGIGVRKALGEGFMHRARPWLQMFALADLLVLIYSNVSAVMPRLLAAREWDFLVIVSLASVALCSVAFAAGWGVAAALGAGPAARRSLMFGLGMTNNGTGLVLAITALAHLPRAMLPVIVYTLVQHLMAGAVDRLLQKKEPATTSRAQAHSGPRLSPSAVWRLAPPLASNQR